MQRPLLTAPPAERAAPAHRGRTLTPPGTGAGLIGANTHSVWSVRAARQAAASADERADLACFGVMTGPRRLRVGSTGRDGRGPRVASVTVVTRRDTCRHRPSQSGPVDRHTHIDRHTHTDDACLPNRPVNIAGQRSQAAAGSQRAGNSSNSQRASPLPQSP